MKPTDLEKLIAAIRVQSWDQSIGLDGATALLNGLQAAGLAIVPREPTREMWAKAADAVVGKTTVHHDQIVGSVWANMLSNAPR